VGDTLGWALVMQGSLRKGWAICGKAKLRDSVSPEIRYHLAEVLQRLGRPAEAPPGVGAGFWRQPPNFASIQEGPQASSSVFLLRLDGEVFIQFCRNFFTLPLPSGSYKIFNLHDYYGNDKFWYENC